MYPYDLIPGVTLYDVLIGVGLIAALAVFGYFSGRDKAPAEYHNFILADTVITVICAYALSVLTQSVYNWIESGEYRLAADTGATFLGGLVGGAAVFIGFYFIAGRFRFRDGLHLKAFGWISEVAAVCIPLAHAFGRLGCLTAGCCYGIVSATPEWYTFRFILVDSNDNPVGYRYALPIQLIESVFLFALAAFLFFRKRKNRGGNLPLYMVIYGIWRFAAEYFRADDRGQTFVSFLSPSQLTSVILVLSGAAILIYFALIRKTAFNCVPFAACAGDDNDSKAEE